MHCLHLMTSVASGDLSRLTHTYCLQILAKLGPKTEIWKSYKPHAVHVPFYTVKHERITWRRGCHVARIPCFPVYFTNLLIFTVFYRVKCVFQEIAKTLGFYRVNRASGPKKGPEMDPKMDPRAPETRVLPGVVSHRPTKNTMFYCIKWIWDRPRFQCEKMVCRPFRKLVLHCRNRVKCLTGK